MRVEMNERVLEVRGTEARDWLQGQLTCDIPAELPEGQSVYGLLLSPKGKVIADTWIDRVGETYRLRIPRDAADAAFARLDRYLVMEDVDIEWLELRVVFTTETEDGVATPRLGGTGVDLLVSGPEPAAGSDQSEFHSARIQSGIPFFGVDFGESTLPQEAGLKHAVSFHKGCYIGQEPVVMLEHRGKPPRRLVHLSLPEEAAVGTSVSREDGKAAGELTSVSGRCAIAMVKRRALDGALSVNGQPVTSVKVLGDEEDRAAP